MVHVVVCDDYEPIVKLIAVVLSGMGMTVSVAGEGCEALELVQHIRPDLIISDIDMPGLNGISIFKKVQSDTSGLASVPFILMSSVDKKMDALDAGCSRFLTKPFSIDDLQCSVRQALAAVG